MALKIPWDMRKKKSRHRDEDDGYDHGQELEILKAVAQAWHAHSSSCRPTNEYDAHLRDFQSKPSRFKLEAMKNKPSSSSSSSSSSSASASSGWKIAAGANWDFNQSLWDSYEIVTVTKRLERELALDNVFEGVNYDQGRVHKRRRESKNSLRDLLNRVSSWRYNEPGNVPREAI